jgi:4'-phosphopantetheinyl transferase
MEVWTISPSNFRDQTDSLARFLAADEAAQANTIADPDQASRFVIRRALLRLILASKLGVPPAALEFDTAPEGKPRLAARHRSTLQFNGSHSADRALVAVSTDGHVGIDVERMDPGIDHGRLARGTLDSVELDGYHRQPDDRRLPYFVGLWAGKEAVLKGLGLSLHLPTLSCIRIPDPATPSSWAPVEMHGRLADRPAWQVRGLDVGAEYAATLALPTAAGAPDIAVMTATHVAGDCLMTA